MVPVSPLPNHRRLKAALVVACFAAFAVGSALLKNRLRQEESPLAALPLGRKLPDFSLPDTQGAPYTLSKLAPKQKIILINFWATWCGPCRIEMPELAAMAKKDGPDGLLVLGIDEDEDPAKLTAYLRAKPLPFPVLIDQGGALAKRFGIQAYPTTVLVSTDGRVLQVFEGVDKYLQLRVTALLLAKKPGAKAPTGTSITRTTTSETDP